MPKNVTEDDLASGIRSMGGLGSLARNRRDSPFRDSRTESETVEKTVELPLAKELTSPVAEVRSVPEVAIIEPKIERPRAVVQRSAPVERPRVEKKKVAQRKADVHTERVTLQISPEMRDEVDSLARDLQRAKTSKNERISMRSSRP